MNREPGHRAAVVFFSKQVLLETGSMSDERFDGKSIYKFMSASTAVYDIRGRFVHKARSASMPEFEIRGDHIYKARSASGAVLDIRGDIEFTKPTARPKRFLLFVEINRSPESVVFGTV